jgi:hypothetical protein
VVASLGPKSGSLRLSRKWLRSETMSLETQGILIWLIGSVTVYLWAISQHPPPKNWTLWQRIGAFAFIFILWPYIMMMVGVNSLFRG